MNSKVDDMVLKLVILDLDQTLVDNLIRFYNVFCDILKIYGLRVISWDEFLKLYENDELSTHIPKPLYKRFWNTFLKYFGDNKYFNDKLFEGAREALEKLKNMNLKIVIATGRKCPSESIWSELRELGIDSYIDAVFTGLEGLGSYNNVFSKRPLINKIIKEFNVKPWEIVIVGDYKSDLDTGDLRIIKVGISRNPQRAKSLLEAGAITVLESITQLPTLIRILQRFSCPANAKSIL